MASYGGGALKVDATVLPILRTAVRKVSPKPRCKTGCITCRIRRIKCDEAFPTCLKCNSTGRKCDSYENPTQAKSKYSKKPRPPLVPKNILLYNPGSVNSPVEQRCLQYFNEKTATALSGYFDCDFWTAKLLQAGSSQPAVLHAIVTLSLLHEGHEVGGDLRSGNESNYLQRRLAIQQYGKAIGNMAPLLATPESSSSEASLMACLLFTLIEVVQLNYSAAVVQLKMGFLGLAMLAPRSSSSLSSGRNSTITHLFSRIFIQSMFLAEPMFQLFRLPKLTPRDPALPFLTIGEARESLDSCFLSFYPIIFAIGRENTEPITLLPLHFSVLAALNLWKKKFQVFLCTNCITSTLKQQIGTTILRIHTLCLEVMIHTTTVAQLDVSTHFDIDTVTGHILLLCTSILESRIPLPNFSFDHGLIAPLYFIVIKCPSRSLRLQALELLNHPRIPGREGIWSADMNRRMAAQIFAVSEEITAHTVLAQQRAIRGYGRRNSWSEATDTLGPKVGIWYDKEDGDDREIKLLVGKAEDGQYMREVVVNW